MFIIMYYTHIILILDYWNSPWNRISGSVQPPYRHCNCLHFIMGVGTSVIDSLSFASPGKLYPNPHPGRNSS